MKKYTLHIALTNVRMSDEKDFIKSIESGYYRRHKNKLIQYSKNHHLDDLYIPFKYYVLGNYDIALISLINNYDVAQKLFIPKFKNGNKKLLTPSYSYQIITGILNDTGYSSKLTKELYDRYNFLGITNLKLNNGFIIGNGILFTDNVSILINKELNQILGKNSSYIILHSFSWFEFSVLIFTNDPDLISKCISVLRSKRIMNLAHSKKIVENSSKFNSFRNVQRPKNEALKCERILEKSNIFSDTQSYFCVNYNFLNKKNNNAIGNLKLNTEIEWQLRPGHLSILKKILDKKLKSTFNLSDISLITGKSDYVIKESKTFINNYRIQQIVNKEIASQKFDAAYNNQLINHVGNIKTKIYLKNYEFDKIYPPLNPFKSETSFRKKINHEINIDEYNLKLKRLKISKQCRVNVLKMFYHYSNGIKDPVLSIYFFDFFYFIKSVESDINNRCNFLDFYYKNKFHKSVDIKKLLNKEDFIDVQEFEIKLAKNFEIFEEAFNIRMLNSYRYEDISDINLDFNSSIQQLLSMYNTLAHVVGDIFQSTNNNFIVLINYKSTVANIKSINYSIYDLLTPEFIFYSLPKEILNYYHFTENPIYGISFFNFKTQLQNIINNIKSKSYSEYLSELLATKILDFDYLFIELIRFYFSFNLDEGCYLYWTWSYAFKNSSAYNVSGSYKEEGFISELIKIIFTLKIYNCDTTKLRCPLPQLETYWKKLFPKINSELTSFFLHNTEYVKKLKGQVLKLLNSFIYFEIDDTTFKVKKRNKYFDLLKNSGDDELSQRLSELSLTIENKSRKKFEIGKLKIHKINLRLNMYRYLRFIYSANKSNSSYINFLYRDWNDGNPLIKFNEISSNKELNYYYRIDQTGGVFFPSGNKMEEYFQLRNSLLVKLWDFAMRETNELIKEL